MKNFLFKSFLFLLFYLNLVNIHAQDLVTSESLTDNCSCTDNKIVNPSFETNTNSWIANNGTFVSDSYAAQCGTKAGHFKHNNGANRGGFYQDVAVTPGTPVNLKFFGGVHDAGPTAKLTITFYNGNSPLPDGVATTDVNAILPAMAFYTLTSTAPATTTKMRIEGSTPGEGSDEQNGDWLKVDGFCLTFTTACNASITGLKFYDTASSATVNITNNATYDINTLPSSFGLEAIVAGASESMTFSITGSAAGGNTENVIAYTYPGTGNAWPHGIGTFTVVAKVYSDDNAGGQLCDTETFTFTLTNNECNCPNNLLLNGSFENYNANTFLPNNWVEENGVFNSDDYAKQCGNKSGIFKQDGSANIGKFYQQVPNIAPGTNVSLTFFAGVHDPEPADAFVKIIFYNGTTALTSGVASVEVDYSPLPGMQKYTLNAVAPPNTTSLRVEGSTNGESGSDNDGKDGDWLKVDAFCLTTICIPVYAGTDGNYEVCDNDLVQINLNDYITGEQSGGVWTLNGQTVSNMLTPVAGNSTNEYIYTIIGTAPCGNDESKVTVKVNAKSNAGTDGTYEVCDNALVQINLNDYITGEQAGGTWSANGQPATNPFTPAAGNSMTTYTYTVAGTGNCPADESTVTVKVNAKSDAGTDGTYEVCDNALVQINLNDYITGEQAGGTWSANGQPATNPFTPAAGNSMTTYTYTVAGTGNCPADESTVAVKVYQNLITVNAGPDAEVCAHVAQLPPPAVQLPVPYIILSGSATGATSVLWTDNGAGGTFDDATKLDAKYFPPIGGGIYTLTLTSNDPDGICGPIADNIVLTSKACAGILDPCVCHEVTYLPTETMEVEDFIEIDGTSGQEWKIIVNGGAPRTPAQGGGVYGTMQFIDNIPPMDNVVIPLQTVVPETPAGSGIYRLDFAHDSGAGYNVTVKNTQTGQELSISNYCVLNTITPSFIVGATICSNAGVINLTTLVEDTDPTTGTGSVVEPAGTTSYFYTINGGTTEFPIVTNFNPADYMEGDKFKIIAKYNPAPTNVVDCQIIREATGEFTIINCPLSVNLVSFTGRVSDESIVLNWKTADEKDFSHYEILKSKDAKEFGTIGNIPGNSLKYYNFTDNNPNLADNYYRLKMVNNDGSFDLSKVININFEKNKNFVNVENPSKDAEINVSTNVKNPHFTLLTSSGMKLESVVLSNGINKYVIKPLNIASGLYFLNIVSENKVVTKKVIIP